MHCPFKHKFINLPIYHNTQIYRYYVNTGHNPGCTHQTTRRPKTSTCLGHANITLSIYRYIAAHTVTDCSKIQNKILVLHSITGDKLTPATYNTAHQNTTLSIYRYITTHSVTDSKYVQKNILIVNVRPGDTWTTATCTAHSNTNLSIYWYIAAHTVTDSKYIKKNILILSTSDRATT